MENSNLKTINYEVLRSEIGSSNGLINLKKSLLRQINELDSDEAYGFLNKEYNALIKLKDKYELERLENNSPTQILNNNDGSGETIEKYKDYVGELMNDRINSLEHDDKINTIDLAKKLKWNGSPSLFAHIFLELGHKGYIQIPLFSGENNYSEFGRLMSDLFQIETTPQNLKKEFNPKTNSLSDTKSSKITIPEISDLN